MAKRNKQNTQVILDFNANKLFVKLEKMKETLLIDLDGIGKDEVEATNRMISSLNKKGDEADVTQYEHLTQARVYRQIIFKLSEYFKVELAKKVDASKLFIQLIIACPYDKNNNANMSMTDVELIGVIKNFFAGTKGIMMTIAKQAPVYNLKTK